MVGICLRARKHKLIEFEGEMLFQRRDDDVPIFLLKPIKEIRQALDKKAEEIKRGVSPAPQATSVLMDKRSRSPSPNISRIEPKKQTAKVPEIKEPTKQVDPKVNTKGKIQESVSLVPPPIIEVLNEKEETVTVEIENTPVINVIDEKEKVTLEKESTTTEVLDGNVEKVTVETENTPVKVEDEKPVTEVPVVVLPPTSEDKQQESEQIVPEITHEGQDPLPEENNKEVKDKDIEEIISEEVSSGVESEVANKQDQSELISASSSTFEIVEEIVPVDENNNTSKDEKPNDNSNTI